MFMNMYDIGTDITDCCLHTLHSILASVSMYISINELLAMGHWVGRAQSNKADQHMLGSAGQSAHAWVCRPICPQGVAKVVL